MEEGSFGGSRVGGLTNKASGRRQVVRDGEQSVRDGEESVRNLEQRRVVLHREVVRPQQPMSHNPPATPQRINVFANKLGGMERSSPLSPASPASSPRVSFFLPVWCG